MCDVPDHTTRKAGSKASRISSIDDDDDPIYRDELWLDSAQVRYSPSGVGHCSSYTVRGFNH